ncbi:MAG: FAD/NAD(P)-dependent oxidoreductase [Alphaproteobacteria bacterium]
MTASSQSFDLAILGAGPAGLAAGALASDLGLTCVLLDEQAAPGGQIYRSLDQVAAGHKDRLSLLGTSYRKGLSLLSGLRNSQVDYRPSTLVWQIDPPAQLWTLRGGRCQEIAAARLLLCNGAVERPVPVPGWTLPGVFGAGAAQILLKSAGLVPDEPTVLIGNGPLLYLLLAQYQAAGVAPTAVLLTDGFGDWAGSVRHLPGFLASGALQEAAKLLAAIRQTGARIVRHASEISIIGKTGVEAVSFVSKGRQETIPARLVCLHEGVVPNIQLTRLIGCAHRWDKGQQAFRPVLDRWGNTTAEAVQVAGDGGGISGAPAAALTGRIAVFEAAHALGRLTTTERDRRSASDRRRLSRLQRARPFIDALYGPRVSRRPPGDETIVCRCEEVTAKQIRQAVREGCQGPNQAKSFLRCGMGPCQGRFCGLTVSQIIATERGVSMDEVGYFRIRPPIKPIDLGALAATAEA